MKHLITTALLCGASVLAGQAQNIVIIDKDGIPHKFKAENVQEITFEQIEADAPVNFESLHVNPYSKTNIELVFASGDDSVSLDLYQQEAYVLQPGRYFVSATNEAKTIDPGYSVIVLNGEKQTLTGGDLLIAADGENYTFDMALTMESGDILLGKYTGKLDAFSPVIDLTFSEGKYVEVNEPAPNGFYYRFNDADWKAEVRIDLFSEGETPAPGVYTFSDTMTNGTASSNVDLYSPYNTGTKFTSGTVTVSGEGSETVMEIDGTLDIGIQMKAVYKGQLPARPAAKMEDVNLDFDDLFVESYGTRNVVLTFNAGDDIVGLDTYQPAAYFYQPGTYVMDSSCADYTIDPGSFSFAKIKGERYPIESGEMTVTAEGEVYTFELNFILTSGAALTGKYTGTLNALSPVINFDLTSCSYVEINEPAPNGFYYRFNDANSGTETRIDLFSEGSVPAPGVYTFSDTMENGTASSKVDLYSPYNTNTKFTSGKVTVSGEGSETVVEIEGTLDMGLQMKAVYKGQLPTKPAPKEEEK